jgi:hypothetical protein
MTDKQFALLMHEKIHFIPHTTEFYRVFQKSLNGFARPNLRNPWDYRNGIGAKRCVLSLSFV